MRHKRAKTYKRAIAIYTTAFGFRTPFQVLVSNDVLLALNRESDIVKQLSACCQGEIKPMITQCCVEALYKLGKDVQPVTDIAKTFERRRCNHRTPLAPDECLTDVIGSTNKHRYVLAAQSKALRTALAGIPGVPIIHFNPRGVLVLSPPSHATLKTKDAQEESRRLQGAGLLDGVHDGENVIGANDATSTTTTSTTPAAAAPPKRSRAKGPNPLSVKKKKAAPTTTLKREEKKDEVQLAAARKSRRKRGKGLVKQVREEMAAEDRARGEAEAESRPEAGAAGEE